jgi:hypothetical protein
MVMKRGGARPPLRIWTYNGACRTLIALREIRKSWAESPACAACASRLGLSWGWSPLVIPMRRSSMPILTLRRRTFGKPSDTRPSGSRSLNCQSRLHENPDRHEPEPNVGSVSCDAWARRPALVGSWRGIGSRFANSRITPPRMASLFSPTILILELSLGRTGRAVRAYFRFEPRIFCRSQSEPSSSALSRPVAITWRQGQLSLWTSLANESGSYRFNEKPNSLRLSSSPKRLDRILPDLSIAPEESQSLGGSLRDKHPIERVVMERRQSRQG